MTNGKKVVGILFGLCLLSAFPLTAQENSNNVLDSRRQILIDTARDVEKLNAALLNYWQDNKAWPVSLAQLQALGYINAIPTSPRGTPYTGTPVNANRQYRISFDLVDNTSAATVAGVLPNGTVVGAVVSTTIETPNSSNEYQTALGRNLDPDFADRVVMKNNLDMGSNSISNVNTVTANDLNSTTVNATNLNTNRATVGRAVVGAGSIQSSGTNLNVTAQNVTTASNASAARNVSVTGRVQGNSLTTNNLNVGGNIASSSGNLTGFSNATGSSANVASVTASSVNTGAATVVSGTSTNVTSATVNAGRGTFNGVTTTTGRAQSASAQGGSIRNATGGSVSAQTFTGNTVAANTINAQSSNVGSAMASNVVVSGQTTGTAGSSNTSTSNALNATTANATNYNSTTTSATTARVNGNAVLTGRIATSGTLNSTNVRSDQAQIGTLTVRNGATVSGTSTSQNLNVATNLQTQSINAQNANINTLNGSALNATNVTANTVNAANFTGQDFVTPVSSVLNNRNLIIEQKNKLDNCMYATEYCFPKPPAIANPQCPNCTQSGYLLSFSAVATAEISSCQHGCSYEWIVGGSAAANCPSGNIPKMNAGSVSVSCTLTRSQSEGTSSTGTVSLVVKNARRNEYSATRNFNYAFTSQTASVPSSSIACTNCTSTSQSNSAVNFSSTLTASFANCEYGCSLSWTGVCNGTIGNTCFISRTVNPGTSFTGTAGVTVVSNANPLKQSSASRNISYTVDYPACPSNQVRVSGVCQCPVNTTWNGSTCVVNATPVTPIASTSCTTCNQTASASTSQNFTMVITGNYGACDPGRCTLTWGAPPTGFTKSSCNDVTTPSGTSTGTTQCTLTTSVSPNSTRAGNITYTVRNVQNTSLVTSVSQALRAEVTNALPPTTPLISASCTNCTNTASASAAQTYNMTITGSYDNCQVGRCTLTWGAAPAGFNKTTCNDVTTPLGTMSGTVQCSLSTTVTPGTTRSGSIQLTARNVQNTALVASTNQNMSFTVDTVTPRSWRAGCFVDTNQFDYVDQDACTSFSERDQLQEAKIVFSAGDAVASTLDHYNLTSSTGISIAWSGDCTGSGVQCSISRSCTTGPNPSCPSLGTRSATVRIFDGGVLVFQRTVYAEDGTTLGGTIID